MNERGQPEPILVSHRPRVVVRANQPAVIFALSGNGGWGMGTVAT
ncbi:MAG: hypothetical protein NZ772_09200 [Cyanobacteria bacterium]|nr:hypothetical protein [Cyanobacteriota bacterium]